MKRRHLFLAVATLAAISALLLQASSAQDAPRDPQVPGQRQRVRDRATRSVAAPTHADVSYGPYERNVMDVWLADSDQPTPVLVSIHGGGFRGGNKSVSGDLLRACLESGISVVAITYRLSDEAIAPAQFLDSARAIQFIRHQAKAWNLDPTRIAATGGSAGAGLSLWLGFHDDLADPDHTDPVLRQSTRLSCMAVYNGQTSYDPRVIRDLFPDTDTYLHPALAQLYDVDLTQLDDLPKAKYRLMEEVSASPHLSQDDPPAMLIYAAEMNTPITNQSIGIHHPRFGKVLKEKMDALGIECEVLTGTPRGSEAWTKPTLAFVRRHLRVGSEADAALTGTVVIPADLATFAGRTLELKLWQYDPRLADVSADLFDERLIQNYGHQTGASTETKFALGKPQDVRADRSYYFTVFVTENGKRTHMGEKDGERGLCKVINEGEPRTVQMILRELGR